MAPPVGLEPTTCGLTVRRSTDWAKGESLCSRYLFSQVGQGIVLPSVSVRWHVLGKKKPPHFCGGLCWYYLFSQAVTRQVSSAQMSLTSVFGMGTGGPSSQSTRTHMDGFQPIFYIQALTSWDYLGDPYRIRTDVNGVRGRCLNHLTNGPLVHLQGLEPGTHWLRVSCSTNWAKGANPYGVCTLKTEHCFLFAI